MAVLETAAGSGIVTQLLREALPASGKLVATDLNEAMVSFARQKLGSEAAVEWKMADAMTLPFEDESFDAVVCQFGLMFVPETPYGFSDESKVRRFLEEAGFQDIILTPVELTSVSPTAADAARGLVQGTPVMMAVKERDATQIPPLTEAVAAALERELGGEPCRGKMRALVWEATR